MKKSILEIAKTARCGRSINLLYKKMLAWKRDDVTNSNDVSKRMIPSGCSNGKGEDPYLDDKRERYEELFKQYIEQGQRKFSNKPV